MLSTKNVSAGRIHLTSSVINNVIRNCVAEDPSIKVSVVRQMVKDQFGVEVIYKRAWCAKQQALVSIYGTWEDSYPLLPRLLKAMQVSNPGTVVEWSFKEDNDVGVYVRPSIRTVALVTALVERRRQETHTFHLPLGEAIVTLLDVAVLTRLPIEGHDVYTVGRQLESWQDKVHRVLGVRPPPEVAKGSELLMCSS